MYLNKLYTGPVNLFQPVGFHSGLNFIYGIKDNPLDSNESLNGIGKSLLLDFLDFALLSHFNSSSNSRLARAYKNAGLNSHYVILEFEIDNKAYSIMRYFDTPSSPYFSDNTGNRKKYKLRDLQKYLFKLIFERKDYPGFYNDSWYTPLMKFFTKIQKVSGQKFTDPICFMNSRETILNQYHLFLLDINNSIAHENFESLKQLDNYKKTINTTRRLISENFNLKDFAAVQTEINRLENQIKETGRSISSFRLSKEYDSLQQKADLLTAEIHSLSLMNSADNNKIRDYLNSTKEDFPAADHVKTIYDEAGSLFGDLIKKRLDEVIEFRRNLIDSRKDFINREIEILESHITERNEKIADKENERSEILKYLSSKNALVELTSAYQKLNTLTNKKAELSSKLDLYKQSKDKILKINNSASSFNENINNLANHNSAKLEQFNKHITELYSILFGTLNSPHPFSIKNNSKEKKIKLSVLPDDIYSHGKNQARTLIYDLSVLCNSIENNIKGPRFLVHDGIFDSLDKSHFISLYEYCDRKVKEGNKFQYIVTLNEQGTTDERFGTIITRQDVINRSIKVLTPSKKLLGTDFK